MKEAPQKSIATKITLFAVNSSLEFSAASATTNTCQGT